MVTGVSGSGKSSLAFDTLYAEGQRRYVETFSPYARQFMDRMDRPRVEKIDGIPPAVAIDRKDPVRTSRSTVGTMTEITDYVKLLFARRGRLHCRDCGRPVASETPEDVWQHIRRFPEGSEVILTFPWRPANFAEGGKRRRCPGPGRRPPDPVGPGVRPVVDRRPHVLGGKRSPGSDRRRHGRGGGSHPAARR